MKTLQPPKLYYILIGPFGLFVCCFICVNAMFSLLVLMLIGAYADTELYIVQYDSISAPYLSV